MKYVILTLLLTATACGEAEHKGGTTTVVTPPSLCNLKVDKSLLIIGDSISLGYTDYVQKDLCGHYNVDRIRWAPGVNDGIGQNAQGTTYTLANLDRWLSQAGKVDVITWNNGLWNARNPVTDPQAPGNATDVATYRSELIQIAIKLKATGVRIIFLTTTDIPASGSTFLPGRDLDENAAAQAVLPSMGIEVYDLNAMARSNPKLHHTDDPIHFDAQGYSLFGEYISDMVMADYERSN